jgi:hypothetical protein
MTELATRNHREDAGLPDRRSVDLLTVAQQADRIKDLGRTLIASGLLPDAVKKPEAALAIMLQGQELQIGPMYALSNVAIVNGKPVLSAELMAALVRRAGHKLRVIESTDERCTVEGIRRDDPGYKARETFTMADAKRAGLAGKGPWRQYPRTMLRWRAISALCKFHFGEVLGGAYVPEELGVDFDEEGRPVVAATSSSASPGSERAHAEDDVVEAEPVVENHGEPEVEAQGLTTREQERLRFLIAQTGRSVEAFEEKIGPINGIDSRTGLGWIKRLGRELRETSEEAGEGSWGDHVNQEDVSEEERPHDIELDEQDLDEVEGVSRGGAKDARTTSPPKARKSQIDLLKTLAEELRGEGGVQRLETRIGKPLSELTVEEANEWLSRLSPEEE